MSISRRDALLGASAAVAVAGVPTAVAAKAGLAGDPAIALARQLRVASQAWFDAIDVFDEATHRVGRSCFIGQKACREIGIETLWQEREHWKAQFWDLRECLLETPAATPRGVLAKLRGFFHDGEIAQIRAGDDPDDDLPKEFAASVYRDLERLAGEARS